MDVAGAGWSIELISSICKEFVQGASCQEEGQKQLWSNNRDGCDFSSKATGGREEHHS
jgi:hypothetical protein